MILFGLMVLHPASLIKDYLPGTVNNDPSDPKNIIYVVKNTDSDFGQSWQRLD